MTNRLLLACFAVALISSLTVSATGLQNTKPTVLERVRGSGGEPVSLEQAVQRAEAVLYVRVLSKTPAPFSNPLDPIKTDYSCLVLDVLKAPSDLRGQTIIVRRGGGTREESDRIRRVVDPDFPEFGPGEEYVLLPRRYDASGPLEIGAPETYQIRGGVVAPMSRIDHAQKEAGRLKKDFWDKLQQMVGK